MMTERQAKILAAVIEQYAELATPVGSVLLAKLFDVSPATMRSEMAKLEEMGYLTQPHTSAGRIPTDKGYRLYVNSIVETNMERKPTHADERYARAIRARVSSGGRADLAIRAAVDSLVELTHNLGIAILAVSGTCSHSQSLWTVLMFDQWLICWITWSLGCAKQPPIRL